MSIHRVSTSMYCCFCKKLFTQFCFGFFQHCVCFILSKISNWKYYQCLHTFTIFITCSYNSFLEIHNTDLEIRICKKVWYWNHNPTPCVKRVVIHNQICEKLNYSPWDDKIWFDRRLMIKSKIWTLKMTRKDFWNSWCLHILITMIISARWFY